MNESEYWECRLQGDSHAQQMARYSANVDMMTAEEKLKAAEVATNTRELLQKSAQEALRPFVILNPRIFPDGDQWCVLLGDDLQEGVAGFGDTPDEASRNFDHEWLHRRIGHPVSDVTLEHS